MERKEAIEIVRNHLPHSSFTVLREALETLIPELKESEDERMLREIKSYIKEQGDKPTGLPNGTVAVSDMIAWLEKQGETFTKKDVDDAWLQGMCDAKAKEDLFNYTNILSAEENTTLENLINKLAVSGIKQYNTQEATILFKNWYYLNNYETNKT